MIDMEEWMTLAKVIKIHHGKNEPGIRHGEQGEMTTVYGYDKEGKLLFFGKQDAKGNFRLSLYSEKTGERNDYYSDDLDDPTLSEGHKKRLGDAKKFIDKAKLSSAKTQDSLQAGSAFSKSNVNSAASSVSKQQPPSLPDLLKQGIKVNLSKESRLSFAPDIESLQIVKDKNGMLRMSGVSEDGKQRIDFSLRDGNIQFELQDGDIARSYNNKMGGKWTWRNLKSSSGTRYIDNEGENYAKEMAGVMDKLKMQYQSKTRLNMQYNNKNIARDAGR